MTLDAVRTGGGPIFLVSVLYFASCDFLRCTGVQVFMCVQAVVARRGCSFDIIMSGDEASFVGVGGNRAPLSRGHQVPPPFVSRRSFGELQ